jgi:hypothetical protein
MALAPLKHDVGDGCNTRDLETIIPGAAMRHRGKLSAASSSASTASSIERAGPCEP